MIFAICAFEHQTGSRKSKLAIVTIEYFPRTWKFVSGLKICNSVLIFVNKYWKIDSRENKTVTILAFVTQKRDNNQN